jgi:hypothetical protein
MERVLAGVVVGAVGVLLILHDERLLAVRRLDWAERVADCIGQFADPSVCFLPPAGEMPTTGSALAFALGTGLVVAAVQIIADAALIGSRGTRAAEEADRLAQVKARLDELQRKLDRKTEELRQARRRLMKAGIREARRRRRPGSPRRVAGRRHSRGSPTAHHDPTPRDQGERRPWWRGGRAWLRRAGR